jgi:hypothetical protein
MTLQAFMGVVCRDFFWLLCHKCVSGTPAALFLATQELRRVPVKRPHVECGFRLTCGLKRLLLLMYEGWERGTIVPHGLHTIADAIVPDGWHTQLLLLWLDLQLQASSCPRPLSGTINNTSCSFSCLQSVAVTM